MMGRLTKDPEIRETPNNILVASFSLAVDKRAAKKEDRTADFFNCVAWRQTAEFMKNYMHKGNRIAVSGRLQNRNWDDAEGKKHYATEVVCDEVFFADSKSDGGNGGNGGRTFAPGGNAGSDPMPQEPSSKSGQSEEFYQTEDDDLPF